MPKESMWHILGERQIYKFEKQQQAQQKSILQLKDIFSEESSADSILHKSITPTPNTHRSSENLPCLQNLHFSIKKAPPKGTNEVQVQGPLTLQQHPKRLICQTSKTIFKLKTILKTQKHPSSVIRFAQLLESTDKYSAGVLQPYRVCYI